jgi:tocopherol cyclase
MEHFAPHPKAAFEGYYSKFDLPSGARLALIICCVPSATTLPPYMVSFTYYPNTGSPIFQREHWVASIERIGTGPGHAFELRIPGMGSMSVGADSTTTYELACDEWSLEGMTVGHTPWQETKNTPEGWLVRVPLPLHWHVHSLGSDIAFQLDIPSAKLPREDRKGRATVHQEKNWANSFPSAHVWVQARDPSSKRGICLAGGKLLGLDAFLLGYRSPNLTIDMAPPFALAALGISPFMSTDIDYSNRTVTITISNIWYRIKVQAQAPKEGGWFGLGCPFPEGHRKNYCTESYLAVVDVEVCQWSGLWAWKVVAQDRFENASLEFAGGYYPGRGEKTE